MKKLTLFLLSGLFAFSMIAYTPNSAVAQVPVYEEEQDDGEEGGGGTSCTVTSNCYGFGGIVSGSVSCTGSVCSRGSEWVKCDGVKTVC